MKTSLLIAGIVILSILSMAPDFYFPIASRPCPEVWVRSFIEYDRYSHWMTSSRFAGVGFPPDCQAMDAKVYDVASGEELRSAVYIYNELDFVAIAFSYIPCEAYLKPYQARFVVWFDGGCQAEVVYEWTPTNWDINGCPPP